MRRCCVTIAQKANFVGGIMTNIIVLSCSHRKRESGDFHGITENGFDDNIYLFVHFLYPAIVIFDGVEYITDRDACVLYTPNQRIEYKAYNGVFVNNFIIFKVEEAHFPARFGLPENEIFYISNEDEITRQMELITHTITDKMVDKSDETQGHVETLFNTISNIYIENNPSRKRYYENKQRFIKLRDEVQKKPGGWTVDLMAQKVWFTRSRFTVLYNEFFDTSPKADLVMFKMEYAKKLLETTDLSITAISKRCGYTGVQHFIRMFNKVVNKTPLQYRKYYLKSIRIQTK